MKPLKFFVLALCLNLVPVLDMPSAHATSPSACHFKVGVVPQFEQRRLFKVWRPLLDRLGTQTGCTFDLVGSKTIIEFEKAFKEGTYDFAYMNPYHAVMAKKFQGYEPIVRSGSKKLKGILVVRKDSPIKSVKELHEKTVAFPSPNALGASLLMRAELAMKHGTKVNAQYVKTHSSVYLHVAKGLTDAGGGVGRTFAEQSPQIKKALRILYTTTPVNAHPLVVHPRVESQKRQEVQKAWLELASSEPALLAKIPMKDPIATSYKDYVSLETLGLESFVGTQD